MIRVYKIDWYTDNEKLNLPFEIYVSNEEIIMLKEQRNDYIQLSDKIVGYLSDVYNHSIISCIMEEIEDDSL